MNLCQVPCLSVSLLYTHWYSLLSLSDNYEHGWNIQSLQLHLLCILLLLFSLFLLSAATEWIFWELGFIATFDWGLNMKVTRVIKEMDNVWKTKDGHQSLYTVMAFRMEEELSVQRNTGSLEMQRLEEKISKKHWTHNEPQRLTETFVTKHKKWLFYRLIF